MTRMDRRRFLRTAATTGVAVGAGCTAPRRRQQHSLRTEPGWAEFRGDRYNTGYVTDGTDVENPSVKWTFEAGDDFWGSPVVADGLVFTGSADTHLYAIDAETGEETWSFQANHRIESTPAYADGTVFVGSYDRHIYALDADTGEVVWDVETGGLIRGSPKVVDETVYIGVGCNNLACAWYAEGSDDTGWVYALDAETGDVLWRFERGAEVVSTPAVGNQRLYIGSSDGYFYAIDRSSGEQQWRYRTRDWIWSAPTLAAGTVYFTDWNSKVFALDAATGEEQWTYNSFGAYISGSTAVDEDTVYFGHTPGNAPPDTTRENAEVFALDRDSGEERWTYRTDALEIGSSPLVTEDTIYIGSHSQVDESGTGVYALTKDGARRWFFEVKQRGVGPSPALLDGVLYFGAADDTVYALEDA